MNDDIPSSFASIYTQQVIWGDMDAFGHLNNVMFYRYIESARIHYLYELKALDQNILPIVSQNSCQYLKPVFFGDTLHIGMRITDIRSSAFKMQYYLFSQKHQSLVAIADAVVVMVDSKKHQKTAIPQNIKNLISQIEQKQLQINYT